MPETSVRSCVPRRRPGVRNVLLGPGCAGAWTARVLRAGQGAHFFLAIREQADLRRRWRPAATSVATVAHGGTSLYDLDLGGPAVWLVGNEGAGLSAELVAAAKLRATIPLAAGTESLNVAAAVGSMPVRGQPPAFCHTSAGYVERIAAAGGMVGVRACAAYLPPESDVVPAKMKRPAQGGPGKT
jgi:tRNA(Leu) C34 or U34 (ribose-2'-O)-methylase TrmL